MSRARTPIPLPVEPVPFENEAAAPVPPPRPMWQRGIFWLAVAVVLAAIAGAAWRVRENRAAAKPAPVVVRSTTIRGGVVEDVLRLTGVTAASSSAALIAPQLYGSRNIGGGQGDFHLLLEDLVPSGSFVNKGDQVAAFDRQFMALRLDDHLSNVRMHEAYMRVLTAEFGVRRKAQEQKVSRAKRTMDKAALDLKTAPVRSAIQTERFQLTLDEARARYKEYVDQWKWFDDSERSAIRRLEFDIKEQRLGLQRAQRNLDRMLVRAPIPGIVVMQSIHRGGEMGEIQKGDQVHPGQLFAQVVDQRSMVVNAEVNQVDAERLRLGLEASVHFDAYPELELPARVEAIGIFANSSGYRKSYVKSIPVRLKLERMDRRVIPNFTVSADVVIAREEQAAVAPLESVFTDQADAAPHVFVRTETGWERRVVELGLRNNVAAAVREGLEPGEVIALELPPTQ